MIRARMIIEIMGRPPEHVLKAIELMISKLGQEKGVTINTQTTHEPMKVKEANDLYTTFAELEVTFDSVPTYLGIMFAYLPSNIEIIEPQELRIKNQELTSLGNTIISRIHSYDAIAKRLIGERDIVVRKLQELTNKPVDLGIKEVKVKKNLKKKQPKKKSSR